MLLPTKLAIAPGVTWPATEDGTWLIEVLCSTQGCGRPAVTLDRGLDGALLEALGSRHGTIERPSCREHITINEWPSVIEVDARRRPLPPVNFLEVDGFTCPKCYHFAVEDDLSKIEAAACRDCDDVYRFDDPSDELCCPSCDDTIHLCGNCGTWMLPKGPDPAWDCDHCREMSMIDDWETVTHYQCQSCSEVVPEDVRDDHQLHCQAMASKAA